MSLLLNTEQNNNKNIIPIIPQLIKYGFEYEYNYIITSPYTISLNQLFNSHNKSFSLKKACELILYSLQAIEVLHKNNIIHRDINPKALSLESDGKVKFIYLGFWKYYKNNKKHIPFKFYKKIIGKNFLFGSINNLMGVELSRRDDLQSLAYMLIYFIKGNLPWDNIDIKNSEKKMEKILEMKLNIDEKILTEGLPNDIKMFFSYVKKLKFEEEPNYDYLKNILKNNINLKDSDKNYYFNL